MSSTGTEVVACAGGSALTNLLHDIAGLPQVRGSLSIEPMAGTPDGLYLVRTDTGAKIPVAVVQGGEAEGYARMLSGAPAMLDLLAALLVRWGDAVADDDEINGGDAVAWLSQYAAEVREALQAIVGPLPPEPAPRGGVSASPS